MVSMSHGILPLAQNALAGHHTGEGHTPVVLWLLIATVLSSSTTHLIPEMLRAQPHLPDLQVTTMLSFEERQAVGLRNATAICN